MDRVNRGFFSNTMRSSRGQLDNFQRGTGGGRGARKGRTKDDDEHRRRPLRKKSDLIGCDYLPMVCIRIRQLNDL